MVGWFMVFDATFKSISVISWQLILLVEETADLSQVTDKLYHISCFNKNITNNLNIDSQFIWLLSNEDTDVCRSIAKYLNLCFLLRTKV